jgi:hypothetical protein
MAVVGYIDIDLFHLPTHMWLLLQKETHKNQKERIYIKSSTLKRSNPHSSKVQEGFFESAQYSWLQHLLYETSSKFEWNIV